MKGDLPSDDARLFVESLRDSVTAWNLSLTGAHESLLLSHFTAVVETNRVMNLTRITTPREAAVQHYADSLALLPWLRGVGESRVRRVLDVGTGAGFPAVPLAVMEPGWRITAMDGTGKKTAFVQRCAHAMGLTNLEVRHGRADKERATPEFDLVLARAVAKLDPLLAWLSPWVRADGRIIAWKSASLMPEETSDGERLAARLRLTALPPHHYELPGTPAPARRTLLIYGRG